MARMTAAGRKPSGIAAASGTARMPGVPPPPRRWVRRRRSAPRPVRASRRPWRCPSCRSRREAGGEEGRSWRRTISRRQPAGKGGWSWGGGIGAGPGFRPAHGTAAHASPAQSSIAAASASAGALPPHNTSWKAGRSARIRRWRCPPYPQAFGRGRGCPAQQHGVAEHRHALLAFQAEMADPQLLVGQRQQFEQLRAGWPAPSCRRRR